MRPSRVERFVEVARVERWERPEPPDEGALLKRMLAEGLEPYRWSNEPYTTYAEHRHTYVKVLYVVRGSISFTLSHNGRTLDLRSGDRLDLPAYTAHTALVGPGGVVCLEAPRK
jgi:quercetin dioxygenase-like cupin family protein